MFCKQCGSEDFRRESIPYDEDTQKIIITCNLCGLKSVWYSRRFFK